MKRTSPSKKFFSQEKLGIHCITLIFFFFLFFSKISPTFLFLAATRPLPVVGFSLTPVKPRFFVLGFDFLASSCTASPDSFLLPLGCSLLTKTQETVHLRLFSPFQKKHRLTIKWSYLDLLHFNHSKGNRLSIFKKWTISLTSRRLCSGREAFFRVCHAV